MKYIIANWKMNMDLDELEKWLVKFGKLIEEGVIKDKVVLACSFPHLYRVSSFCAINNLACAAQDSSFHEKGAHTGEVGSFQLRDFCRFVIIGHSERTEPREMVLAKRDACLAQNVTPIVCFTRKEDWEQNYKEGVLLAWEDPENISKGGVYREKDSSEIKDAYAYFAQKASRIPVIYGGSIHRQNVNDLVEIENLGGVLVGNASLDPDHFMEIIKALS